MAPFFTGAILLLDSSI